MKVGFPAHQEEENLSWWVDTDMSVVLLLISHEYGEHLSFHDDEAAALAALTGYVHDHWADADLPETALRLDVARRIEIWFKATGALYIIGKASITDE